MSEFFMKLNLFHLSAISYAEVIYLLLFCVKKTHLIFLPCKIKNW